jgi:Zn finger protein HypA/HybF involved in hydrogenase expression
MDPRIAMTVIYLQCQREGCRGLGTRTRTRERCKCCGHTVDVKNEVFTCRLCGGNMIQVETADWDLLWHWIGENGQLKYPHEA